jgi:glucose-6-phosphate isomerase
MCVTAHLSFACPGFMAVRYDFTNMLTPACANALPFDVLAEQGERFAHAYADVAARRASGSLGFPMLPDDSALRAALRADAFAGKAEIDDVILCGIGGSALGPIMLRNALCPPRWNELDRADRNGWPRLHVLDNVDPVTMGSLLDRVDLRRSRVLVISKSGGTAETMSQYLVVREKLAALGDDWPRRVLRFITDPDKGVLRAITRTDGIITYDIPSNVGGRFSVLSAVGLAPAAFIGLDIDALCAGAAAMRARCEQADLASNPAGVFAVLQQQHDRVNGRQIHVLMPYADALRDVANWFVQLWAESLGKITPSGGHVGPTPVPALGATDQHAQVQNFMEGPHDKTVTFIAVESLDRDLTIPSLHGEFPELAYLGGSTIGALLDAERRATAGALASTGRPNGVLTIPQIDAAHLGELIMFFEYATAYAGALYGIDAYNQPGVELGKQFTYGIFGRPGFEADRERFQALAQPDARCMV